MKQLKNPLVGSATEEKNPLSLAHISIYNSLGKMVLSCEYYKLNTPIDLSANEPGIYLVKIKTSGIDENRKIVLER